MPLKFLLPVFVVAGLSCSDTSTTNTFNMEKDLLLVQYDCKTDVDDLHSVAAFRSLLAHPAYQNLNYHAVAGTYGTQDGLYVPPNALLALAFDTEWSDAHAEREEAVDYVMERALALLRAGGDVWIAEAGQSDFSAAVVRIIQAKAPGIDTKERVHVVQHSDWNEQVTTPEDLQFVQQQTDYHKIPDGNAVGNGTPGFRDPEFTGWQEYMPDEGLAEVWQLAIDLGNQYNGKDGRYNNEAVAAGGLDFSDFAEVCWILGIELEDTRGFFETFGR